MRADGLPGAEVASACTTVSAVAFDKALPTAPVSILPPIGEIESERARTHTGDVRTSGRAPSKDHPRMVPNREARLPEDG